MRSGLQKLLRKHGPTTADLLAHRADARARARRRFASAVRPRRRARGREGRRGSPRRRRPRGRSRASAATPPSARRRHRRASSRSSAWGGRASSSRSRPSAPARGDALLVDGARLTRTGIDRVEFLIAPNRGEEPRPLRKIASGGELSRALLALKRVLAEQGPAGHVRLRRGRRGRRAAPWPR